MRLLRIAKGTWVSVDRIVGFEVGDEGKGVTVATVSGSERMGEEEGAHIRSFLAGRDLPADLTREL